MILSYPQLMPIATINPATGQTLRTFPELSPSELEEKIELSWRSFLFYRQTSFTARTEAFLRLARLLETESRKQELAQIITMEMGKPIQAAIDEVAKCAWVCRHYAEVAPALLARQSIKTQAAESYVMYQPLGPVLAVMPWNFPFWQVFRAAAPALMAGNTMLLKHASNVPQCSVAIETLFNDAGFERGAFQSLLISSQHVRAVLEHEHVKASTLTGSEHAGSEVGSTSSRLIKPSVLELGGSDPFIVLPSADLKKAVQAAVKSRTISNGQSCIAAKRFIVHEKVAAEFTHLFAEELKALRVGDPMEKSTQLGPLATADILGELESQIERSVKLGAKVLVGGKRIERPGNFFEATLITDISENSPLALEEVFGPVAALFVVKDFDEALRVANHTRFGLGSSVWTQEIREQILSIEGLEAGQVFINALVASDPRLPFGGIKKSGYGRELGTPGLHAFVNQKTVWVEG